MYNLKIAFRGLWRKAFYSRINIVGLAVSMAAVIFILFWIKDECSYDSFHKDADNIYIGLAQLDSGGEKMYFERSTGLFAPAAYEHFDEVTAYCRTKEENAAFVKYENERICNVKYLMSDSTFFRFLIFLL
ncbi:MAG: hypothetical protein LBG19_09945 [Prevotellaceae bacterium]|jgi:putative ABC transport system permease protein|nr:hypothetical protein [Prevotellaceae bacterium]